MSSSPFVTDLTFALQAQKCVHIERYGQSTLEYSIVAEVNEAEGWVTFHAPEAFGDATTRIRVSLTDISSVTVTNVAATL